MDFDFIIDESEKKRFTISFKEKSILLRKFIKIKLWFMEELFTACIKVKALRSITSQRNGASALPMLCFAPNQKKVLCSMECKTVQYFNQSTSDIHSKLHK